MSTNDRIAASLSLDGLGDDARAAFDLAADAGYAGVAIPTNYRDLSPAELGPSARRHLQRILLAKNLRLDTLRIAAPPAGLADPASIERTIDNARKGIALAFNLGVPTVSIHVGDLSGKGVDGDSVLGAARLIAEEADRAGLNVAFGADGAEKLAELIKVVAYDRARANVETAREIAAGEDPLEVIGKLRGAVAQVTLADAIRSGRRARIVELGQGSVALAQFLQALCDSEFNGPLVVDVRDLADGVRGAAAAAKILRGSL